MMNRKSIRNRSLRFESLENRQMLSVNWIVNTQTDSSAWSETDDILSLREAVARAEDGDTITFDESLNGKVLSVKYGEMAVQNSVTIDASNLDGTETEKITIDALSRSRLFNVAEGVTLTINSVCMKNGYTGSSGGMIYTYGTLNIINSKITASATTEDGGAIFSYKGDVTLTNTAITSCTGSEHGGAIYTYFGTLTLDGCTIDKNTAGMGGGLNCYETKTVINNTSISSNRLNNSYLYAGGIHVIYGSMTITNSTIENNISYNWAGGMQIFAATVSITNSIIAGNSTLNTGGGIQNFGYLTLTQCTITNNTTTGEYSCGAGIYNEYDNGYGMYINAYNCIVAANTAGDDEQPDYAGVGYGYAYNTLSSNQSDWTFTQDFFTYDEYEPLFFNIEANDYTLAADSQVLNLGENSYAVWPDGSVIEYDIAGNDRFRDDAVDLGAYEYVPKQVLDTPSSVKVQSGGANRMTILWDEVKDAVGYMAAWSTDLTDWTEGIVADNTITVTGLTYDTSYYVKVKALGDNEVTYDSGFSAVKTHFLCPVDIDSDGFIGPGDYSIISKAWFTMEGDENWDQRCDIDGDGFVGPGDCSYLSIDWFLMPQYDEIIYPPALAEMAESDFFTNLALDQDEFTPAVL